MLNIIDVGHRFGFNSANRIFASQTDKVSITNFNSTLADFKLLLPKADLVVLGGGADIHPSLYDHENVGSYCGTVPSSRDLFEVDVFKMCQKAKVPILGICRGAQLACIMSGGALIQHIGHGHTLNHVLQTNDGRKVPMTSAHHQMMYLPETKHELLAWIEVTSKRSYNYDASKIRSTPVLKQEPEVVFFPTTRALAIQGHPEYYMDPDCEPVQYVLEMIYKYLLNKEKA